MVYLDEAVHVVGVDVAEEGGLLVRPEQHLEVGQVHRLVQLLPRNHLRRAGGRADRAGRCCRVSGWAGERVGR